VPGVKNVARVLDTTHNAFGFVAYNQKKNEIVVSFRGTNGADKGNWQSNLDGKLVDYKEVDGAKAHEGFHTAYESISSGILEQVKAEISRHLFTPNIIVTGHSLGGAMAVFAAIDIKTQLKPRSTVYLYTYG
jgi:predicted lipase